MYSKYSIQHIRARENADLTNKNEQRLHTISEQESLATAKTTARCAQYIGAPETFESPD